MQTQTIIDKNHTARAGLTSLGYHFVPFALLLAMAAAIFISLDDYGTQAANADCGCSRSCRGRWGGRRLCQQCSSDQYNRDGVNSFNPVTTTESHFAS